MKPIKHTKANLRRTLAYWQGAQARLNDETWESCPHPETKTCNLGSLIGQWRYGYNFARDVVDSGGLKARADVEVLCKSHIEGLEQTLKGETNGE